MKAKNAEHDILVFMYLYRKYVNPHLYKKALSLEANRSRSRHSETVQFWWPFLRKRMPKVQIQN